MLLYLGVARFRSSRWTGRPAQPFSSATNIVPDLSFKGWRASGAVDIPYMPATAILFKAHTLKQGSALWRHVSADSAWLVVDVVLVLVPQFASG